ncbi:carbohydrate ABC transporter permease [Cohnella abietis]|uniref:Putative ABC transporter permease protein YtcP n=1 Tax=Cohnella abietis TaxID=2507935 RepID=A0A3T1D3S9_9BACL|nr:carbohydrate ABC transporter permease [Cohnella abietis]BBI32772.1 putative ABC transporter permease protein YtcP [Cohnella abietis]
MDVGHSTGRKLFLIANNVFLLLLALSCLLPFIHILAVSFSSPAASTAGEVKLWPVEFTWKAYEYVIAKKEYLQSLSVSFKRVVLGTAINMLLTVLTAYPLSKTIRAFPMRTVFAWFFVFTILFGGGLIPWYIVVKYTGLMNSLWALVVPGAVQVYSIIILLNFFRQLPRELEESAFLDGAGHMSVLLRIYIPLSGPALATLLLFSIVDHWNAWFDGLILMNSPAKYPLQSYMQTIVVNMSSLFLNTTNSEMLKEINDRTVKAAQILVGALPVLLAYPFLQRHFIKGIVLGSVKE